MTLANARSRTDWARVFQALALIAVVLRVLVPPGFMVGPANAAGRAALPLVICTGHGPVLAAGDHAANSPGQKHRSEAPCAFAGHASVAAPPTPAPVLVSWIGASAPLVLARFDLAPGRGMAAPPPPSHAPPTFPI